MRFKFAVEEMSNGRWRWQGSDYRAKLGDFGFPKGSLIGYILGGGIYGDGPDYPTAEAAAKAAVEWWRTEGRPHSQAKLNEEQRKRGQIKKYGRWFPIGQEPTHETPPST